MLTGRLRGFRFTSDNGYVQWREEYDILEIGEILVDPVARQTAPDLGFSVPVEVGDRRRYEELIRALNHQIGVVKPLETAVWREWWREPLPSAA